MIFPHLSFETDFFSKIAIGNPSGQDAEVTLNAYDGEGHLLTGTENPVFLTIPAYNQTLMLTSELFGGELEPSTVAWLEAISPSDDLTGSFLYLNTAITLIDSADLPKASEKIVFSQVRGGSNYWTDITLLNPGNVPASVQLELVTADSESTAQSLMIPGKGIRRVDVAQFFETTEILPGSYLLAQSDVEIAGFALIHAYDGDSLGLNAQDAFTEQTGCGFFRIKPECVSYVPQMAVLGSWQTGLGLVNYSTRRQALVTVSAFSPEGLLYEGIHLNQNPVILQLEAGRSLFQDLREMFGFHPGEETLTGYIKIESSSPDITAYLNYEMPITGSWTSVPATAQTRTRALFSDLATSSEMFMGLALLNPGALASNIRILAIQSSGQVLGSYDSVLHPGQSLNRLVDELIPQKAHQPGGLIWVKRTSRCR